MQPFVAVQDRTQLLLVCRVDVVVLIVMDAPEASVLYLSALLDLVKAIRFRGDAIRDLDFVRWLRTRFVTFLDVESGPEFLGQLLFPFLHFCYDLRHRGIQSLPGFPAQPTNHFLLLRYDTS